MHAHQHLKPEQQLRWFEEKVTALYSRSLFLRQDEAKALQESAQILDQQTASLFLIQSSDDSSEKPLGEKNLKRLIEALRKFQSARESDSHFLARLREDCLAYRKAQLKKGFLRRILSKFFSKSSQERISVMQNESLKIDLEIAALRQYVSTRFFALMIADRVKARRAPSDQDQVEATIQMLKDIRLMRKKNYLYRKLYLKKARDIPLTGVRRD